MSYNTGAELAKDVRWKKEGFIRRKQNIIKHINRTIQPIEGVGSAACIILPKFLIGRRARIKII